MDGSKLGGVIAAIVTPVDAAGEPDTGAFVALAERLLAGGCDGLNVLGTTGEATSLSLAQRRQVMRAAAGSGLPVGRMMVGTGAAAVADAVDLAREAADCGFAAALALPPFYYKGVGADGVLAYLDRIAEATAARALPLYLYNFPALSGVAYAPDLVARAIARFPDRVAGLKDSSGDLAYARGLAAAHPGFAVFPSNEGTLAEARSGGPFAGCISATLNIRPEAAARALHAGDDRALAEAVAVRALFDGKALVPHVKALVARIAGLPGVARTLPPFTPLDPAAAEALHAAYLGVAERAA